MGCQLWVMPPRGARGDNAGVVGGPTSGVASSPPGEHCWAGETLTGNAHKVLDYPLVILLPEGCLLAL